MTLSFFEIRKIEEYYDINLPIDCKEMLLLLGSKIINLSSGCFFYGNESLSIYKIQREMRRDINEPGYDDGLEDRLKNVFF